jgi:hypothetical protein
LSKKRANWGGQKKRNEGKAQKKPKEAIEKAEKEEKQEEEKKRVKKTKKNMSTENSQNRRMPGNMDKMSIDFGSGNQQGQQQNQAFLPHHSTTSSFPSLFGNISASIGHSSASPPPSSPPPPPLPTSSQLFLPSMPPFFNPFLFRFPLFPPFPPAISLLGALQQTANANEQQSTGGGGVGIGTMNIGNEGISLINPGDDEEGNGGEEEEHSAKRMR